jgi:hypothetical protein
MDMPVLLLARGDAPARNALRTAIETRYGSRPPVLDSLQIGFKGRAYTRVGPVNAWVPTRLMACFQFPVAMRWDYASKPLNLPLRKGTEAFDGAVYCRVQDNTPTIVHDNEQIASMRCRLWAMAAMLLTPLSDMDVELSMIGPYNVRAVNTRHGDVVEIFLRRDNSIECVQTYCLNTDTNKPEHFTISLSEEMVYMAGLVLPAKIAASWNGVPSFEAKPVSLQNDRRFPADFFSPGG